MNLRFVLTLCGHPLLAAMLVGAAPRLSRGADSYDGTHLAIASLGIGTATFSNVVLQPGVVQSVAGGVAAGSEDNYDPATRLLTVPAVNYGTHSYTNVVATVGSLESIGSVSGVDTYDGVQLVIPSVQVLDGAVYTDVIVTVGTIVSIGGGMPGNRRDGYDPASRQLTITAIMVGGRVYTNVVVTVAQVLQVGGTIAAATRPLPLAFRSARAINYSPYGSGQAPLVALPTAAQIDAQLQLIQDAGFSLLRLFGSDATAQLILREAQQKFPLLNFQLGIYVAGPVTYPTCRFALNTTEINTGIALANTFTNVVAVSVGNETSLSPPGPLPVSCLAVYLQTVREAVAQPVTTDDTWPFFAGDDGGTVVDGVAERPDTLFPLLDYVSIHAYPFLSFPDEFTVSSPPLNPAYAEMTGALTTAQNQYQSVVTYMQGRGFRLPITVGETGWKARFTAPQTAGPETCCASPVNQKWYADEMLAWAGQPGGPVNVFLFEAFDEGWKQTDNGWGLWDEFLNPRYALCGTGVPNAPACASPDPYEGACYKGAANCPADPPYLFAGGFRSADVTIEGGSWGFFTGGFPTGASVISGGGFTDSATPVAAANSYFFFGMLSAAPPTSGALLGIYVDAPGYVNGIGGAAQGLTLRGQTTLTLDMGVNQEWLSQATNTRIAVVLLGSTPYSNGTTGCHTTLTGYLTPLSPGPAVYSLQLSELQLTEGCNGGGFASGITTAAQALALPIAQINLQAAYPDIDTTVPTATGNYATALSLSGSVFFQ